MPLVPVCDPRCLPDHESEPSAHHPSLSFVQAKRDESYVWATPVESWMIGAPFGRTEAVMMEQLGSLPRIAATEIEGKRAFCFLMSHT